MLQSVLLIILSYCEILTSKRLTKSNDIIDIIKYKDRLYYPRDRIDDNNDLILNFSEYTPEIITPKFIPYYSTKISAFVPYSGANRFGESFLSIQRADFVRLKTTQTLNQSEIECNLVRESYEEKIYSLLGYTIRAIKGLDIAPSITYIAANRPSRVIVKFPISQQYPDQISQLPPPSCDMHDDDQLLIAYVLRKYGVVGTDRASNSDIPTYKSNCFSGSLENFDPVFKGYTLAIFRGNMNTVKDAIIRFGAVNLNDIGIIIGWEGRRWIVASPVMLGSVNTYSYMISEQRVEQDESDYEGEVIFNLDIIKVNCVFDSTAPECSGQCMNNVNQTTEQCGCIVGDMRLACQDIPKQNAGSIRVTLSFVVAVMFLPMWFIFW
ncbi:MAG: hypothetical protein EZS28_032559 [Streblomastix strix]|uniref:EGF-like domain-containing protein n=1 Tax=Streblomastix strix TaxID=222440 RepID=A0A5J4UP19_9EUKA|nr:MAG: hypothetical protein EZS28_032559 [Streblomastix strix]